MIRTVVALALLAGGLNGAGKAQPWNFRETAMTADGRLTLLDKPWWPRAQALGEGESFTLDLSGDGKPDTMVLRKDGNIVEIIDDSNGRAGKIDNQSSSAWLVSLKGTGLVDRMVVYIDNNGDGKADEQEFRHYKDGYLRYCWFSEDYDGDGLPVFAMKNWSYAGGDNKDNHFRGNMMIFLNKYDTPSGTWVPLSECPFSFWDLDKDGRSDVVLRVSAAPLSSNKGKDPDYANHYEYMWSPKATPLAETGNMNVRYSYNIDPAPRTEPYTRPHANFGFNMVGEQPYNYAGMSYTNPLRRPPQTVVRIPWKNGMQVALQYPAQHTGFTWDEARSAWRWEGQFWIFEREYMPNTGGPVVRFNMRREYAPEPTAERKLYYSPVDRRYHLLGARVGWMEVGYLVNQKKDLEFRYSDANGDGYLDTWEVFEGENPVPVRVTRLFDVHPSPVTLDREWMQKDYNQRVLPEAIAENRKMIEALKKFASSELAEAYLAEAGRAEMPERQRYALDVARELYFLRTREALYTRNQSGPYPKLLTAPRGWMIREPGPVKGGYTLGDTLVFWKEAQLISRFVEQYGAGEYSKACQTLEALAAPASK
jgi:hypothetical protein